QEQARDLDVLASRDLGMETGAELEKRRKPAGNRESAPRRSHDAGQKLQERGLAGSVRPDDPEGFSLRNVERDVFERRHAGPGAAAQKKGFQRAVRAPPVPAVNLGHPADRDRRRRRAAHASSARESRSFSKRAPPRVRNTAVQTTMAAQVAPDTRRNANAV